MFGLIDSYSVRARLAPAILAALPVGVSIVCLGLAKSSLVAFLSAGVVTLVGAMVAMQITRDLGKKVEARLFEGGKSLPTTIMLRHSDSTLDPLTKAKVHQALVRGSGHPLPSANDEVADLAAADSVYTAAVNWLREHYRKPDTAPVAFEENVSYGFRRNLRGLRWIGLLLSLALLAGSTWKLRAALLANAELPSEWLLGGLLSLLLIAFWLMVVRDTWVEEGGRRYARALLLAALKA